VNVVEGLGWPTIESGALASDVDEGDATDAPLGWMVPRETAKD